MTDSDLIDYLKKEKLRLEKEIRDYRAKNLIVYCENCGSFLDDLEGARAPDYEGYCPNCGEESNWTTEFILDKRDEIIDLLNDR